jgi:A/G-specific adenine glycosylase
MPSVFPPVRDRRHSWRHKPTPYRIMIAEFLLQRTKASQVEPVYKKFIAKYPNVERLAKAKSSSVSKFTENLGLHKRSENFIKAAKFIDENYSGRFPHDRERLLEIPGIGDYVAGAILTVCFNKPEYVIDSNIARFINRCYGLNLSGELRRKKQIINIAKQLFNYPNTRDLLFALLDFTSFYCQPSRPDHKKCSLNNVCNLKAKK